VNYFMSRFSNSIYFAGLFILITAIVMVTDAAIVKTRFGKSKGYVDFKASVRKFFGSK
jgi:hypothetical protein